MEQELWRTLGFINAAHEEAGQKFRREVPPEEVPEMELLDAYSKAVTAVVDAAGPAVVDISIRPEQRGTEPEQAGALY